MIRRLKVATAILAVCGAMATPALAVEDVTVATGQTFLDLVFNPAKEALAAKGMRAKIIFSKPVEALAKVDAGEAELGGASLASKDWLEMADKAGVKLANRDKFNFFKIMEEETVLIVHKDNPVQSLTKEQVSGIFTGKIQNWKEVGGVDSLIMVVYPQVVSGGTEMFSKKLLDGAPVTKEVLSAVTIADTPEMVAASPEAISIANGGQKTVKVLTEPKLTRSLMLVSNGKPTANAQKLLDFLTGEGKKFLK